MYSREFMGYLMNQEQKKDVEKEHYIKKGLLGLINFVNAKVPVQQKSYN